MILNSGLERFQLESKLIWIQKGLDDSKEKVKITGNCLLYLVTSCTLMLMKISPNIWLMNN